MSFCLTVGGVLAGWTEDNQCDKGRIETRKNPNPWGGMKREICQTHHNECLRRRRQQGRQVGMRRQIYLQKLLEVLKGLHLKEKGFSYSRDENSMASCQVVWMSWYSTSGLWRLSANSDKRLAKSRHRCDCAWQRLAPAVRERYLALTQGNN
jgi:hypothetical protein